MIGLQKAEGHSQSSTSNGAGAEHGAKQLKSTARAQLEEDDVRRLSLL
jgi:hypothetical protein